MMFFVFNKAKLQRIISIVREDKKPNIQEEKIPYLRIEAFNEKLTVSSSEASATFPCTVYETGVLFIKTTNFRKVLKATKIEGDFLSFQVTNDGLIFADVHYDFAQLNMVLYPNPSDAPEIWPPPAPEAEQLPKVEKLKAMYQHKSNGNIYAIETDEYGNVIATAGPLLFKDINPNGLGYDKRWNTDVKLNFADYLPLSKLEYKELLKKNGFFIQQTQKSIFDELNRNK